MQIKYGNTKKMKADGLTKPLEGAESAVFWKDVFMTESTSRSGDMEEFYFSAKYLD